MQGLIVALIVVACMGYAAWTLMPSAARRALAGMLLKVSWPAWMSGPLRRASQPGSGCGGCGSCGDATVKPIRVVRR
ncbi:MAG TPA: DUF6587 family protein [Albitalea sp.]|uniref:DUF6587 family protein n=1 Tax=Piscinibacter sp. TaxID=1903157 RepID=UPI002ED56E00